jgi:hypothetical protein
MSELKGNSQIIDELRVDNAKLLKALQLARARIEYLGVAHPSSKHLEANEKTFLPAIDEVIAAVGGSPK